MSRSFCLAAIVVGLGLAACSKSTPDQSSTTTTNGESVPTPTPSGTSVAPATLGAPGAPGAPGQRGPSHRMQAFLDGCNGKNASDACTVTLASRTLTGTCTSIPQGPNQGQLSCRPAPGQLGPHHPGMENNAAAAPGAAPSAAPRPGDPGYTPPPAHPPAAN